jgi:hypothetical protein
MPDELLSTDALIAWGNRVRATIASEQAAVGARLRAQDAAWLAEQQPTRSQTQQPSGEVYDPATKEWVNPLTGARRLDASTWTPPPDQRPIKPKLATPPRPLEHGVDPEPDVGHARNGDTSAAGRIRVILPPAPPGTLLLMQNTNLDRRFLRIPEDTSGSDQLAIPVLPADFDLQTADDYEVCCSLWLRLTQYDRFTLASWQQHCRAVFGIGVKKAKRLHRYLRDCGSLEVSLENRPRTRPITWYRRSSKPPTRLQDSDDVD